MTRTVARMVIAALALLIGPVAMAQAGPVAPTFPALAGDVVDDAHILSSPAKAVLAKELADFRHATGHRLVIPDPPAPAAAPDDSSLYTGGSTGCGGASDSW